MIKRRADRLEPLPGSRLAVPPLPAGYVERPRLLDLLDRAAPTVAVTAPAGWGKTVLLSAWARRQDPTPAWLTLEPGDADAAWPYLRQALWSGLADRPASERPGTRAAPGGTGAPPLDGPDVPPLPDRPGVPPPGPPDQAELARLAGLIADRPHPLVLIIDDAHHLRQHEALTALSFLVRHTAGRLRLVLAGRAEPALPLHRWRLAGTVTDVSTGELAVTEPEARAMLDRHGLLWLPDARVRELAGHAEGWPAGLCLAALSLRRHPGPAAMVAQVSGEDPPLADYLAREVLDQLPAGVAEALVTGSVAEWLGGGLLDALTGRADGEAVLADLAHAGAFVRQRETLAPSYRFHRFFLEFLRSRLRRRPPEVIADLHRRAADWLAGHGHPVEALGHALRAPDWQGAAEVLIRHWPAVTAGGQHPADLPPATPPPWPEIRATPELALAYAVDCLRRREFGAVEAYLHLAARAEPRLPDDRARRLRRMLAAARLTVAQVRGDPDRVRAHAAELTRDRPPPAATALAHAALGATHLDAGELDPAGPTLLAGLANAEPARLACPALACLAQLALLRALRGELAAATQTALDAFDRPACPAGGHQSVAYLATALTELYRDHPAAAQAHLDRAAGLGTGDGLPAGLAAVIQAELHQRRGDLSAGYAVLHRDHPGVRSGYARQLLAVAEARLHLARGDPDAALAVLTPWSRPDRSPAAEVRVGLAAAHLYAGEPDRAVAALPPWSGEAATTPLPARVEAGLLAAWAADRQGDRRGCAGALEQALALAEPERLRSPFTRAAPAVRDLLAAHLDSGTAHWPYLNELLADTRVVDPAPARAADGLVEPLTERELTVLRYLQSELSVAEIAGELHLSTNTVKTHLRHIYRKLDAPGRRETVRHARRLRLL